MPRASTNRNLLFSLLALQNNFIDPTAIVAAFHAWTRDKSRPMGQIFIDQGVIDPTRRELLEILVDIHIQDHGGDVEKSLAAVAFAGAARAGLEAIADPDLDVSLAAVRNRQDHDPDATRTYAPAPTAASQRFKILRFHARGGLGEVYVASDEELHREVALKQIQDEHADEPDSRSRFVVEAEITGGLEHPGIVPVYGLGHYSDGRPYYAMRFIRGESLREAIKQFHQAEQPGRDPSSRSLELRQLLGRFLDVCNAVAYAHSRGVLHRDLKPGNVMLGPYGETLVVDWGLAKVVGRPENVGMEETLRPSSGSDVAATRAGVAIGTLSYMSPEQARGDLEKLGPASDVYSLGATLYHLLAGREPFRGGDAAELQAKVIVGDFPPPRQILSSVPAALEAICLKAMAREPEDRYATPRTLADDVEHWLADEPVSAWREPWAVRLARWGRRHRSAVAVAAGLLVFVVLTIYIVQLRAAYLKEETQHYFNRFVLAEREWKAVNIRRAEQLLDECPPSRRGWEWRHLKHRCHEEIRTLTSHTEDVWCVAVSPDGRIIASASGDKTVRFWDATSLQVIRTLEHTLPVWNIAFAPDGRRLGSMTGVPTEPGALTVWDVETGRVFRTLSTQSGQVGDVAFSPDGMRVASTSGERSAPHEVTVWDLQSGKKLVTFSGHDDIVDTVAFSPDGRTIVSASGGQDYTSIDNKPGVAMVWDAETGRTHLTLSGHTGSITGVEFSPDGRRIASASLDHTIKLWDATTGEELRTLRGHSHFVTGVAFRGDGRQLASGSEDGSVKLWDLDTGLELQTFRGHTGIVTSVAYVPHGTRLVSSSFDDTVKVWDTRVRPTHSLGGFTRRVTDVAYSLHGDRLAAASTDRSIEIWDARTDRKILRLDARAGPIWRIALSPDGRRLAAAMGDWTVTDKPGTVTVWDTADGRELYSLSAHVGIARGIAFSPDGAILASTGSEWQVPDDVKLWEAATGRVVRSLQGHRGGVAQVAFSPDGKHLASTGGDRTVKVWEVASGREVYTLTVHPYIPYCLAYSPKGKLLASAGGEIIQIWDAVAGRAVASLSGHTHPIHGLAFHPDGTRLASGSVDETVKIWDVANGQEILTLRGQTGGVAGVAFSPDGRQLAAAGADGTVMVWDDRP